MAEFLAFFSKTVAERCAEGSRQSVEEDQCVFHAHARADGLVGVVICDPEYPWRVAFSLIGKMMEEFTTLYNDFDINLTHLSSPASTNAVTTVPGRVVCITLLDDLC